MLLTSWRQIQGLNSLIHLLEQFTEFRETFYSLDHWFIMKGYNSGTARWKRHIEQGIEKGLRMSLLPLSATRPKCPRVHQPGSSLNPALLGFYGGFVTEA